MTAKTSDHLKPTVVALASLIAICGFLCGCGGHSPSIRNVPALKPEPLKYDWLELTVGEDGKHVYRAEIDSNLLRRRENLTVDVKAGDEWINAASASKESILSKLGKTARTRPIDDQRTQELYHGADSEIIFLGGSFALKGDVLWGVALLDGSEIRIGGEGGKVIHLECERSTIDEILGKSDGDREYQDSDVN